MRSISVVSPWRALHALRSRVITIELKLLSRSPIELNMTRPRGMPMMAYAIVNILPKKVLGVEWP